jgi:hypothetical protein
MEASDWGVMRTDPVGKAKSMALTAQGLLKPQHLLLTLFGEPDP